MEFVAFLALLSFPVVIYGLKAIGVLSNRVSDVALGAGCILIGAFFLIFCLAIFVESGQIVSPSKHGPVTLLAGESGFRCLAAAAFCLFLGGGLVYVGLEFLRKKGGER